MKLAGVRSSWSNALTVLFWVAAIVLAVINLFGSYPGAQGLHNVYLMKIDSNKDPKFAKDRYTVGVYGMCQYTQHGSSYNLESCTTNGRTPYYFTIEDVLTSKDDRGNSAFSNFNSYAPTLKGCMMAVWCLLIVFLGINFFGLVFCIIGIQWSSICREIAVCLGILSLLVNLTYCVLATVAMKKAASNFNQNNGDSTARAHFGGGGVAVMWVLFVFCYLCQAFITVIIKRRNREVYDTKVQNAMNYDVSSESSTLQTPQLKHEESGFQQPQSSPSSTLRATPRGNTKTERPKPDPIVTRPFSPDSSYFSSPSTPMSNQNLPAFAPNNTRSPNSSGYSPYSPNSPHSPKIGYSTAGSAYAFTPFNPNAGSRSGSTGSGGRGDNRQPSGNQYTGPIVGKRYASQSSNLSNSTSFHSIPQNRVYSQGSQIPQSNSSQSLQQKRAFSQGSNNAAKQNTYPRNIPSQFQHQRVTKLGGTKPGHS